MQISDISQATNNALVHNVSENTKFILLKPFLAFNHTWFGVFLTLCELL